MSESHREAGEKRAAANAAAPGVVDALLRERNGYVVRNLPDRVAAVDAALKALGVEPPATASTRTRKAPKSDV
jgi:hypothetical protein